MILIGLENCKPCKVLHKKYPDIPYVVVPRQVANGDKDIYEIKKALGRLGITEFPVLLNNDMTSVLPLTLIDPNIKL
jgi:hypothetical protein